MCFGGKKKNVAPTKKGPSLEQDIKVMQNQSAAAVYEDFATDTGIKCEKIFKLLLLGDSGVGKTCLVTRWVHNEYEFSHFATIGVDFKTRDVQIDGKRYRTQVWDTAGQERYQSITSTYFRGSHGILLCYDASSAESFHNVQRWIAAFDKATEGGNNMTIRKVLVATKSDLGTNGVSIAEQEKLSTQLNIPIVRTSAKTGEGVAEAFKLLITSVAKLHEQLKAESPNGNE